MRSVYCVSKRQSLVLVLCALVQLAVARSAGADGCAQPVSSGAAVTATDCLFLLNVAVGAASCNNPCECAPKGVLPTSATDALLCLSAATGQPAILQCPCEITTSTTTTSVTTTSTTTSTDTTTTTLTTSACQGPGEGGYLAGITDAHNDVR